MNSFIVAAQITSGLLLICGLFLSFLMVIAVLVSPIEHQWRNVEYTVKTARVLTLAVIGFLCIWGLVAIAFALKG